MCQQFQKFRQAESRKWVGDLPNGWKLVRNQGLFDETKTIGHAEEELLSVTIERGIIPQTEITTKKDSSNDDKSKYKLLEPGDLAYNKMRMWQGAIGRSDCRGIVSPAYVVIRPRDPEYSRYFHYLYRTHRFITEANRNSYGLCDDMNSLRYEDFKTIHTPVPPKDAMYRIVSFLDEKTAEIDAAITKKRRLIDLLNEQKAILINRAVTMGLNPDAAMKDSGVDWIGEIPAHWEVTKARFAVHMIDGDRGANYPSPDDVFDEGVLFLSSKNLSDNRLDLSACQFITEKKFKSLGRGKLEPNDIIITMRGTTGHTAVFSCEYSTGFINAQMMIMRVKQGWNPGFFQRLTTSNYWKRQIDVMSYGSAQQQLSGQILKDIWVAAPKHEEQLELAQYSADLDKKFEEAKATVEREISALNEFKQVLVANAVTGKIKI